MKAMNYWLHRCAHEGGWDILDGEHRLTIGFSKCANTPEMVEVIRRKEDERFDEEYAKVYGGEVWRGRWFLWYFTREMKAGDIVIVPRVGGFDVCQLKGDPIVSSRKNDCDIGWEWNIDILANCYPREAYAKTGLLSRMKCQQTTLNIGGLANEIETAIRLCREQRPFSLLGGLTKSCHKLLDDFGSPDHFEKLVRDYFSRLGAHAEILPKNGLGKVGDCDVEAVFPALRLTISVQAKKHWGSTDEWAVTQIADYSKARDEEDNWSYVRWVISFADDFTVEAKRKAKEEKVVLLNGNDFCQMLISNGLGGAY